MPQRDGLFYEYNSGDVMTSDDEKVKMIHDKYSLMIKRVVIKICIETRWVKVVVGSVHSIDTKYMLCSRSLPIQATTT